MNVNCDKKLERMVVKNLASLAWFTASRLGHHILRVIKNNVIAFQIT